MPDQEYQGPRWRTGRHVGRTIYLQAGPDPSSIEDTLIGVMDTYELAQEACDAVNAARGVDNK